MEGKNVTAMEFRDRIEAVVDSAKEQVKKIKVFPVIRCGDKNEYDLRGERPACHRTGDGDVILLYSPLHPLPRRGFFSS